MIVFIMMWLGHCGFAVSGFKIKDAAVIVKGIGVANSAVSEQRLRHCIPLYLRL
jgi:hypothetical protein